MRYDIKGGNNFPVLDVTLEPGEEIISEAGAMCWMDSNVKSKTSMRGGLLQGLKRKALGGESLFQNAYYVEGGSGKVSFVPGQPGSIIHHKMSEGELYMESGAYMVSSPTVQLDTKFEGLKGLFNEGLFVLKAHGQGDLFFAGYGEVSCVEVSGEYIVDNGYAVAWDTSLDYRITRSGKKIRSFLFGDQLILRFSGRGRVWVQSYSATGLSNFMWPYRPVDNN